MEKFVDLKDIKEALEVHDVRSGEPYYLAFVLVGAYQDTMGDMHNLFGRLHEVEVLLDPRGKTVIRNIRRGERAWETMACFGYDQAEMAEAVAVAVRERVNAGEISVEEGERVLDTYRERLEQYTYLDGGGPPMPAADGSPRVAEPRRDLGVVDAAAIFAGIVLGSGIFVAPAAVPAAAPGALPAAAFWAVWALAAACGAFCYAECASRMPRDGGFFVFYREAFGEGVAFVSRSCQRPQS